MTDPTPKQLAMARRIAETLIPDGLDPNLSLRVGIRGIAEQAALAAIIETTEAVAVAVAQSTPQPGAVVNQCLAELGDAEPLVVSKEDDGWAVRTLSAWRLLHRAADDALREENARLRGALRDSAGSLSWAARQMKGNCRGSDIDAVNLAAGDASSVAALTGRQG